MKTVQTQAAEKAKTRDSQNKDLSPIVSLDQDTLVTLGTIHDLYPYDKSKFCQVILTDKEGIVLGILSYRLSYVNKSVRTKYTKSKGDVE